MGGLKRIIECPCRCGTHRINPPFAEPAQRDEYCHENSHSEQKLERHTFEKQRERERERKKKKGKRKEIIRVKKKKRKEKKRKKRREGREKEPWGLNFLR
ncbi:hypothetical protein K0M31_009381 [Melipona bicolor]|uniref:Uncharacterized protein n=1 Tax=Melipona bicolor TaxID=60889 RepID=A0AA40FNW7_9HYME|nr:hypothetical protein K0M31_009381 [Melipona bicolor]